LSVIAIEFSIVFWGATLIQRQTGVSTEAATLLAALFLGGMFVGRLAQSAGVGTTGDVRRAAAIGVVLAGTGAAIAWVSTSAPVSGAALFIAGLGVAGTVDAPAPGCGALSPLRARGAADDGVPVAWDRWSSWPRCAGARCPPSEDPDEAWTVKPSRRRSADG
jgi:hypothetical protein